MRALHRKAAASSCEAQYQLGCVYQDGDFAPCDDREGLRWFRLAAENGSPGATSAVARAYADGRGVRRDRRRAFDLVAAAACANDLAGIMNLGRYYRDGIGVRRDAPHGAAYELARMYEDGDGVKARPRTAVRWMKLAAEFADRDAYHSMGWYLEHGFGCRRDQTSAVVW